MMEVMRIMERKDQVLCKVFEVLKDEDTLAKVTASVKLEEGYQYLQERLDNVTETEYKQAIQTIKENNGKVEIFSDEEMNLSDEELEKISGGSMSLSVKATQVDVSI